jgi:hypothetical protein
MNDIEVRLAIGEACEHIRRGYSRKGLEVLEGVLESFNEKDNESIREVMGRNFFAGLDPSL